MQQILKRLELIKTAITIEDEEIIELQIMKLEALEVDDEVKAIVFKLKNNDFGTVVTDIEEYLVKFSGVVVYEDKEVQGLKLELKVLENKLQELSGIKNEYINDIEEFNTQYRLKLGEIISKILNLEKEILHKQTMQKEEAFEEKNKQYKQSKEEYEELKRTIEALEKKLVNIDEFDDEYDEIYEELQRLKEELRKKEDDLNKKRKKAKSAKEELEDDPAQHEYQEAKSNYEEFNDEYEEILKEERYEITEEEKKELKKLYRKASRLCHPDVVTAELKVQAQAIFQELSDAYAKKDLEKVREILHSLENGISFNISSDTINDKEILKAKIDDLRSKIDNTEQEIEEIKEDETFQTINEIDDMDTYFSERDKEFKEVYQNLKDKLFNNSKEKKITVKNQKTVEETNDNFWDMPF